MLENEVSTKNNYNTRVVDFEKRRRVELLRQKSSATKSGYHLPFHDFFQPDISQHTRVSEFFRYTE
jgi:hypothetical protein